MNTPFATTQPSKNTPPPLPQKDVGRGLTDDERVSREGEGDQAPKDNGARVTPGPEDEKRLKP